MCFRSHLEVLSLGYYLPCLISRGIPSISFCHGCLAWNYFRVRYLWMRQGPYRWTRPWLNCLQWVSTMLHMAYQSFHTSNPRIQAMSLLTPQTCTAYLSSCTRQRIDLYWFTSDNYLAASIASTCHYATSNSWRCPSSGPSEASLYSRFSLQSCHPSRSTQHRWLRAYMLASQGGRRSWRSLGFWWSNDKKICSSVQTKLSFTNNFPPCFSLYNVSW